MEERNYLARYGEVMRDRQSLVETAIEKETARHLSAWDRFKRSFAILAYFNTIGPATGVAILFRHAPGIIEEYFPAPGSPTLKFVPLLGAIVMPTLLSFIEMGIRRCRSNFIMFPNPDAKGLIPFLFAFVLLERPSHAVLGSLLSLTKQEVGFLVVLGTLVQILQATVGEYANQSNVFLIFFNGLIQEPLFTSLGQIVIFGKLLPTLWNLFWNILPKETTGPVNDKVKGLWERVDNRCFDFFKACRRPVVDEHHAYRFEV